MIKNKSNAKGRKNVAVVHNELAPDATTINEPNDVAQRKPGNSMNDKFDLAKS
ncbi:MAG: hypothetical protein OEZ32_03295 [Nitrospinota bacterium]|nr:hypothetical protein [Nitrospinota bacterium]